LRERAQLLTRAARATQQCGRFHDLSAFDANCRSCRKELELHNRRRRKRAAALAAAGLPPSRSRKAAGAAPAARYHAGSPGARSGGADAATLRAHAASAAAVAQQQHAAAAAHAAAAQAASPGGGYAPGARLAASDYASPANMLEQVLGWSALRGSLGDHAARGLGGLAAVHAGGDAHSAAAAAAAAANAGVAAALAAFAARHVGTGASIYGGGVPALPQQQQAGAASGGALFPPELADGGTAALMAAGWHAGEPPGVGPHGGVGGLLNDALLGFPYAPAPDAAPWGGGVP
jgi:hypothetical protein